MKCSFCGNEFDPTEADLACGSCPLVKGCHLVRCPLCGYEMPPEAKLIGWLRKLKNRSTEKEFPSKKELSKQCE